MFKSVTILAFLLTTIPMTTPAQSSNRGDDDRVDRWLKQAPPVGQGSSQNLQDVTAVNNLGWRYEEERGVTQDNKEAVKWYHLVADQGNAMAQNNLGFMYERGREVLQSDREGEGVTQDAKEAARSPSRRPE